MGARELLADLAGAGLSVKLIEDRIIVSPKDRLTDTLREAICTHRAELVDALKPKSAMRPTPTPAPSARIYRLTRAQGDEVHAVPWSAETIDAFTARRDALLRRGRGLCTLHG